MKINDLISLGRLGTVIQNKDFVVFRPNDYFLPAVWETFQEVFLVFDKNIVFYVTIDHIELHGKHYLLHFVESGIPEALANSKKAELMVPEIEYQQHFETDDGLYDPLGMTAVYDNTVLGKVEDYMQNPGQRVLIIVTPDEKEILVPDVDFYVREVDEKNQIIYFQEIGELIDL